MEIAERFRFYKREQLETETVASYIAMLKKLTEHCNFGNHLNEALRDKLVCGLLNENIQKRLLQEDTLTFEGAKDIALAMEMATREATEMRRTVPAAVNKVAYDTSADTSKRAKCYRCGRG